MSSMQFHVLLAKSLPKERKNDIGMIINAVVYHVYYMITFRVSLKY